MTTAHPKDLLPGLLALPDVRALIDRHAAVAALVEIGHRSPPALKLRGPEPMVYARARFNCEPFWGQVSGIVRATTRLIAPLQLEHLVLAAPTQGPPEGAWAAPAPNLTALAEALADFAWEDPSGRRIPATHARVDLDVRSGARPDDPPTARIQHGSYLSGSLKRIDPGSFAARNLALHLALAWPWLTSFRRLQMRFVSPRPTAHAAMRLAASAGATCPLPAGARLRHDDGLCISFDAHAA